jgi:hypothetical protein
MDWILSLIPGGGLTAIIGAVAAGIAAIWGLLARERRAGRAEQKVDHYEKHLEELEKIKRADGVRPAGDELSDPYNRDRRKP